MLKLMQKIAEILRLSKLELRWRKFARVLAIIVVFCTTYMLILPAITMEIDISCPLDEHIHDDDCYLIEKTLICGYEAVVLDETTLEEPTDEETTVEETTAEETTDEETTAEETTEEETTDEETTDEETTDEETTAEETTDEETTDEETTAEETTDEETTDEETTAEETTDEETTDEETTDEETTAEETTAEETTAEETTEAEHIHTPECYEYTMTLVCTLEEHSHNEDCYADGFYSGFLSLYGTNLLADSDDTVSPLADAENPITKVDFDSLDGSGETYYVIYTLYNGTYYAVPGIQNGSPLAITVNNDGTISSSSLNNNYYWNFSLQSGSTYTIQNLGTSRYLHSFYNSSSDYGITTAGSWSSELISTGSGSSETFCVKSNSNYSLITSSGSSVAFATTTTQSSAAQYYIAEVFIPQDTYHVWFDGTCGGLMSLYESPNTYLAVSNESNTITLPGEWDSPSKYSYTLNGWYDIKNNVYYEPGAQVTITKNTVFYADWVATSYDVGLAFEDNLNLIAPSLDTNSFIRTDMFDYSAIFNMQAVKHSGSISASSHSETWSIVQDDTVPYNKALSLGFTFRDWDSGGVNISYAGNRARLNDNIGSEITSGIIDYVYEMSGKNIIDLLFNPETDVIGKNYVGQANYLYQFMEDGSTNYDGEHNGYYYYDSRYNAASYNQTNERFYIYTYLERTSDSLKDSCDENGIKTAEGGYSDFLPFNSPYANNHNNKTIVTYAVGDDETANNYQYDAKATNQSSDIANMGTNYWFGMKSEIQFYLPDDTGTVDAYENYGNISSHGQHMTFEFSGDDDMWVFIDGELVMDIGGLHGIMTGTIDFSTGIITTSEAAPISAGSSSGSGVAVNTTIDLEAGDHTLTVYYMERGGSQSNCAIYFNITPRYGMEIIKNDSVNAENLNGAVFGIYTDIACTQPAVLWTSESAHDNGEESTNEFTAVNGKVSFWGISAGKVYYIKELVAPSGYPLTDDIIRIAMNSLGNSICSADALRGEDGMHTDGFDIVNNSADEAHQQIAITLTNQQYTTNKRNVAVTKYWNIEDESVIPESVTVYLLANSQATGRSAVLSDLNNWSYLWIDLPIYDSIGAKIEYSIYEEQAEDFFTNVEVEEAQTINAWVQTDTFYDGGTFLIVNRETGYALTVNSSGNFEWISKTDAESNTSAHWIVNADGMGFHVVNEAGYHIILDGTNAFLPEINGNRILYYNNFGLAAKHSNAYYYITEDFSASTENHMALELYINMDVLIHEEDADEDDTDTYPEEDTEEDNEIFVTMYNVTNTYIDEDRQTSFNVKKEWEDGAVNHINDSITVMLFANGVNTGRTLTLNQSNSWSASFDGLLYEDASGNKIVYTVEEIAFSGYAPEYSEITEVEGGTTLVPTYTSAWVSTSSFSDGELFVIYNGTNALSRNGTTVTYSSYDENNISDSQKWLVTVSGSSVYLSDPENTSSYFYATSNSFTMSTSNKTAFTYNTNGRLQFTYSNRTRYLRIYNNALSSATSTSNVTSFSLMMWDTVESTTEVTLQPSYSITVTNHKAQYMLPETGGSGTEKLYISGTMFSLFAVVFFIINVSKRKIQKKRDYR